MFVLLVLLSLLASGCSGAVAPRHELRTPGQSQRFIVSEATRGDAKDWALADDPSPTAARVWVERAAIVDLGGRLRKEGSDWACELSASSFRLGHVGVYSVGDREGLARQALEAGAKSAQVKAFEADFLKMAMADLREVTAAVCPGAYFG